MRYGGRWNGLVFLVFGILAQANCDMQHLKLNSALQYEDLLITADEGYFQGITSQTIERLKGFLADFSDYFAQATRPVGRQLSFGTVRLLVPRDAVEQLKVAGYSFTTATWESAASADVRINSLSSDSGSVVHSLECGAPGRFINMPGNVWVPNSVGMAYLTRHFAQYRWGVLSETGVSSLKFYTTGMGFAPVHCSQAIPGKFLSGSGGQLYNTTDTCLREDVNGVLNIIETCEFVPDSKSSNTYASVMSEYAKKGHVKRFCDTEVVDDNVRHDPNAPTVHNKFCDRRSVAAVARLHQDFNASGSASNLTTPTLLLIEPPPNRKIVLVLDISGSMVGNRLRNLITASTRYVDNFVEIGAEVSVISFDQNVYVNLQPLSITSQAEKQRVINAIQSLVIGGATNIAGAMIKAMQILGATAPYNKSQTGYVILITDGQHNTGPPMEDAIASATATSIVFDTLCISNAADTRLANLSTNTGGWAMFSSADSGVPVTTELDAAFAKLSERSPSSNRSILLLASTFSLPMTPMTLKVDESVTTSLNFMLSIPNANLTALNVTVTDPNGKTYGSFMGSSVYEVNNALYSILIKIPDSNIVKGTWTMFVQGNSAIRRKREAPLIRKRRATSVAGSVSVIGGTTTSSDSASVVAWVRLSSISAVTSSTVQKIYATVSDAKGLPVTGATIQASIVSPTGIAIVINLMDDGLGFDAIANDGTYSGGLLPDQLTYVGDYSVTVSVLAPVNRVTSAGKFRVDALASGSVTLPPGVVTDVQISMSVKYQLVTVQFTAPGNQAYSGTAGSHEIRASNSIEQVSQNYLNAPVVAWMAGLPAGSKIQVTLWASNFTGSSLNISRTIYFAVGSISTAGTRSEPSFPMGALLAYPAGFTPPEAITSTPVTGPKATTTHRHTIAAASTPSTTASDHTTTLEAQQFDGKWDNGLIAAAAVMSLLILVECAAIVVFIVAFH